MKSRFPVGSKVLWFAVLMGVFVLASTGYAAPQGVEEASSVGSGGGLLLLAALAAMVGLGSPLFVIIGVLAALAFMIYGDDYTIGSCATLSLDTVCGFETFPAKMAELSDKPVLLAIPFFVVSGAIMSAGDIANRLVAFARALVGWLPGGLAIATVGGCIFFAAISGSSPVTVIAIGTMMYPALTKAGYNDKFSLGLVTTAGSLGILIPPSIPMLVFAIVAGAASPIDVGELFMAGVLPGVLIAGLLSVYSMLVAGRTVKERDKFVPKEVLRAFVDGFWAISLPALILGGIYTGLFTATEAAAVSVVYSLVVELYIHRTLTWSQIPKVLSEAGVMMGTLLIIMALAFGLNDFLVEQQVPMLAVEWITSMQLTPFQFLLLVNLFLLVVGALMDSISAILVIAPLLTPIAATLGIDPIHMGVIFIVNLEIGYLTPPIGINLFVASAAFGKPMGMVIKSVLPFIGLMFVGLMIVTYVPSVSVGPVNVLLRDKPFYEPFPEAKAVDPSVPGGGSLAEAAATVKLPTEEGKVRTMVEITAISGQLESLCYAAEDVLDDDDIKPADRIQKWQDSFEDEDISSPDVLELAAHAIEKAGTPEAYQSLRKEVDAVLKNDWECEALGTLLGPPVGIEKPAEKADGEGGEEPPAEDDEPGGEPATAADQADGDPE
ncbi:MAG: TRAP transporter large permease subunit [Nannocystaceae bacterium]|nr:TRAP transporter large permease subunit [Nannocystaceae bacterium]